jgi:hypothetical protein
LKDLGADLPWSMQGFLRVVFTLEWEETPDYDLLRRLLSVSAKEKTRVTHIASEIKPLDALVDDVERSGRGSHSGADTNESPDQDDVSYMPISELDIIGGTPVEPTERKAFLSSASTGESYGEIIRDYEPSPGVEWRYGRPNYAVVNKAYFDGRMGVHKEGSLEQLINKLVKNWEVESHHIAKPDHWKTMDAGNFRTSVNGGCPFSSEQMAKIGPYNVMLGDTHGYTASQNTFESANKIFNKTFTTGFAWECLEVLSGPPICSFKWRHWGRFSGTFTDSNGLTHRGKQEVIEMFGMCVLRVGVNNVIENMEVYFDRSDLLSPLLAPPGCPYAAHQEDHEFLSCTDLTDTHLEMLYQCPELV